MQLVDVGQVESFETTEAPRDWSDLGRLVRRAAMAAVTLHFAELAADDHSVPHDDSQDQREAVIR